MLTNLFTKKEASAMLERVSSEWEHLQHTCQEKTFSLQRKMHWKNILTTFQPACITESCLCKHPITLRVLLQPILDGVFLPLSCRTVGSSRRPFHLHAVHRKWSLQSGQQFAILRVQKCASEGAHRTVSHLLCAATTVSLRLAVRVPPLPNLVCLCICLLRLRTSCFAPQSFTFASCGGVLWYCTEMSPS